MATKKASTTSAVKKSATPAKKSSTKKTATTNAVATKRAVKTSATTKTPAKGTSKKTATPSTPAKKSAAKKTAAGKTAAKKSAGRKYSSAAAKQVGQELHEMHRGQLKIGRSNKKVTNPKQAIAIGLSEARRAGKKAPPNPNNPKKK